MKLPLLLCTLFGSTVLTIAAPDAPPLLKPNLNALLSHQSGEETLPNEGSLGGDFVVRQGLGEVKIIESDSESKKALNFTPKAMQADQGVFLPSVYFRSLPSAFPEGLTFQARIKPDSLWMVGSCDLLSARVSDRGPGIAVIYHPQNGRVDVVCGPGGRDGEIWGILSGTRDKIPADEWTHIAAIYDANARQFRLYFNGRQVAESATDLELTPLNRVFTIGAYRSGNAYPFRGEMTDIAVYDYPRSDEQILADAAP